ncbi:MAG: efflux RND transporter permease subunit, partial [Gammaproteobacteria bacterium]
MDKLADFAIAHVRFTGFLLIAIIIAGVSTYATQPRQEDPEITLRTAQVITRFPGLAPERVEELITDPIEEKIKEISEIDDIKSISMTGLSIVTPEAHARYYDMDPIWNDLRNKMDDIRDSLPEGVQSLQVNDDYGRVAVVTLALTGSDYTMAELTDVAQDLKDALASLSLVAQVTLHGIQQERIWLEFDSSFLAQFDLTPEVAVQELRAQNVVMSGGSVNADGQVVVIEPSGDFRSLDEIRDLPIDTEDGDLVYLRDIASVRRAYVEPPEGPAFYNNEPAIVLGISMIESSNVVEVGRQVKQKLDELIPLLPLGMNLDIAIFQPDLVQASVSNATINLAQTVAVVLGIVMLFLGWRMGLIVGAMVPLTMMVTLIGMSIWGVELHRISIAAIIVALGLLVDNGVVIAEDIRQRMDLGAKRLDAALASPKTLAIPLLTSSLTTVVAFLPLVLIDDTSGEFLRSLGQVLAISLLSSWLLAVSITPALCYWFMSESVERPTTDPVDLHAGPAYRAYGSLLSLILKHRAIFMLLMLGLLFAAGQAFQFVKQRSLGPSERNQFAVYVDMPSETHVTETIVATEDIVEFLLNEELNPEVTDVLSYVGTGGPRFFLALSPNDPQPNKAFAVVTTETDDQIDVVMQRVEHFLKRDIPQGSGRAEILFLGAAAPGTVELRVRGPNADTLRLLGDKIKNTFYDIKGVQAVRNDWENPIFKMNVEVDQERARLAGVTSEAVAAALSAVLSGAPI